LVAVRDGVCEVVRVGVNVDVPVWEAVLEGVCVAVPEGVCVDDTEAV